MAIRYGVEDQAAIAAANQQKKAAEQAAMAAMYSKTNPSATLATGNVYKPAVQPRTAPKKSWEQMSQAEQKAELDKVNWNQLGEWMDTQDPTWRNKEEPKTTMPVDGGGGGASTPAPVSNTQAISDMYAQALTELQRQYGVSQENIMASIGRMRSDPYNTANAYANMQLADPRVAANPVAEYMAAAGMAPGQAEAAQQMAQAEADAYQRAIQNVQNIMSTSQQQANLSRLADIGLIETGATQDLESNLNMLRLGLEKEKIGAVTGQQQRNLEADMAMRNAIASQISSIFSGQDVAPESILKLIEQALAKINTNRWTNMPVPNPAVVGRPVTDNPIMTIQPYPFPFTSGV